MQWSEIPNLVHLDGVMELEGNTLSTISSKTLQTGRFSVEFDIISIFTKTNFRFVAAYFSESFK